MRRFTRFDEWLFKESGKSGAARPHFITMHCNFCRVHQSLRVTPAMEAGVSDHIWSLDEVITPLD